MPSLLHEGIVLLLRERPTLAVKILRDVFHIDLPPRLSARVDETDLGDVIPIERRADLVIEIGRRAPIDVVVEIQLGTDSMKRRQWPAYLAARHARHARPVFLLVIAPSRAIAKWCARPIELGQPGWILRPLVLGPDLVPVVTAVDHARRAPELAVLSSLVHRGGDGALVALAAHGALDQLDDKRAKIYADLVHATLSKTARLALEALMDISNYEYQSDFAKKYIAEGKAEGEAKGRAEGEAKGRAEGKAEGEAKGIALGRAQGVLAVLETRGLEVPERIRTAVLQSTDLSELDRLLRRAVVVASAGELLK